MRREPKPSFFREFGLLLFLRLPTLFRWQLCKACGQEFRRVWHYEIGSQNPFVVCGHCCKSEREVVRWYRYYQNRRLSPPKGGSGTAPIDPKRLCDPFRPVG